MTSLGFYYGGYPPDPPWLLEPDPPEAGVDYPEWACSWCGREFDVESDGIPSCPDCGSSEGVQRNNPPVGVK